MKTQSMSIKEFMNYEKEPFSVKVERHWKKYGRIYKVAGITLIILATGTSAFAMVDPATPAASTLGIGVEARKLYTQLVGIGKWIIIFKGGIDIIKGLGNGDAEGVKKSFFTYLLMYLFLLALPYGMDQVEKIVMSASVNQ